MTDQELDGVLEAYFDGRLTPEQECQLSEHAIENVETGYDLSGTVVPDKLIPDYDPEWANLFTRYVDVARGIELEKGAQPTEEESELFRAAWLHWATHSGEGDADVIPAFVSVPLRHSDGRSCYAVMLVFGYSFTSIRNDFQGLFINRNTVLRHVRSLGHIDIDVTEPSPEMIERARASSRSKQVRAAYIHPVNDLPPEEFEKRYLRESSEWDRLTSGQLEHLLRRSLLHYGLANDTSLIRPMIPLMHRAVRDLIPERRAAVYRDVCLTIDYHKWPAFCALIPVVVNEPMAHIVGTATIDFVSLSPMSSDGKPAGLQEALRLIRDGTANSVGGVFGGLVALGDERFTPDLDRVKSLLSPDDIHAAARCDTGLPTDSQIRFWLNWAEELMPNAGNRDVDSMIGAVAHALTRIRKRAEEPKVVRRERLFPAYQYECPNRILESWEIDRYAGLIAERLYALERNEPPPKVFSSVLEFWGLPPRAPESDRVRVFPVT